MANLPESSTFDAGVYQLETTDPVIGGPSGISNTPLKNLANRTKYLKDHVDALEATRAPLASPTFTGTPAAPTPAAGNNSTQIATTAFVRNAVNSIDLSGYASLDNAALTGAPTAPTAPLFDADLSIATTEFVQRAMGNYRGLAQYNDTNKTLGLEDVGKIVICGGAVGSTFTLPPASTLLPGAGYLFFSQGGTSIIQRQGTDLIGVGQYTSLTSVTIVSNEFFRIVSNGAGWLVADGSPMLKASGYTPPGMVSYFALATAPNGWLKANGAAISRTAYADLFAKIGTYYGAGNGSTTFNIPDLRGEFLRGWDDGRGIDAGRSLGSLQLDEFKAHSHLSPTWAGSTAGIYEVSSGGYQNYDYGAQAAPTSEVGGSETRPRNIALLACIKF